MLAFAEELLGPYVWGSYDLLVLPPSYPFGGMENPTLTFVTPTVLVSAFNALCALGNYAHYYCAASLSSLSAGLNKLSINT